MRSACRQIVAILAIYAIALNTILWASLAPLPTGAAFDPFTAICHSATDAVADADQSPAEKPVQPSKACDHCSLCGTTAAPTGAADDILAGYLEPGPLLTVLRPADAAPRASLTSSPSLARGPPHDA